MALVNLVTHQVAVEGIIHQVNDHYLIRDHLHFHFFHIEYIPSTILGSIGNNYRTDSSATSWQLTLT